MPRRVWTPQQHRSVELFGGNVLVSASAGTGKTAVLVERALRIVCDPGADCDIDRLLIVTFTRAAAAEMRGRLASALAGRSGSGELARRLARQMVLLDRAAVGTVHSFCGRLVRQEHRLAGADPQFTVLSEPQERRLRREAARSVIEAAYEDGGAFRRAFEDFADACNRTLSDDPLITLLLRSAEFLDCQVDADACLRSWDGAADTIGRFDLSAFRAVVRTRIAHIVARARRLNLPPAHELADALEACDRAAATADLDGISAALGGLDGGGLQFRKSKGVDPDRLQRAQLEAKGIRDSVRDLRKELGGFTPDLVLADLASVAGRATVPAELLRRFRAAYAAAKRRAGSLDFADLEHLALRLLEHPEAARRQRAKYRYVLVDEYQDINPVQDAVLRRLSREPGTLFLVGDVKQSIYAFRGAEPGLFLDKLAGFAKPDSPHASSAPGKRVVLTGSFRSRVEVIAGINALMAFAMVPAAGGVAYDDDARLTAAVARPDAATGLPPAKLPAIELHLIDRSTDDDDDQADPADGPEVEAAFVAHRIARLVRGRECSVFVDGIHRPATWSDIAILLRAPSGRAEVFEEVFARAGVPLSVDRSAQSPSVEVRDVLNLLHVLENPRHDAPLAGALRSPVFVLSDNDLARVRLSDPEGDLFDALSAAAHGPARVALAGDDGSDDDGPLLFFPADGAPPTGIEARPNRIGSDDLPARCAAILARIETWRALAGRVSCAELIAEVFRETELPVRVLSLPGGLRRRAELLRLLDRARVFDRTGQGVGAFARFLEDAQDEEADGAGAAPATDSVRLMSIHRAKGLEFPIVFLPELGKRFNFSDGEGDVLWDREGPAFTVPDPHTRTRRPTLPHVVLAERRRAQVRAEELRLLYTAMTRARDALVLSAVGKADRDLPRWRARGTPAPPLPDDVVLSARSAADWIFPAALSGAADMPAVQVSGSPQVEPTTAPTPASDAPVEPDRAAVDRLVGRLSWRYPHADLAATAARASVTGLRAALADHDIDDRARAEPAETIVLTTPSRPAFLSAGPEAPTAADVGTAVHRLLQFIDLGGPVDAGSLTDLLGRLVARSLIPEAVAPRVAVNTIVRFFETEIGRALRANPGRVEREVEVVFRLPASRLRPDLPASDAGEFVLVRGVIDVLVDLGDGYWILDWKTDAPDPGGGYAGKAAQYKPQLELYREAIAGIRGRPVRRLTLCFLNGGVIADV